MDYAEHEQKSIVWFSNMTIVRKCSQECFYFSITNKICCNGRVETQGYTPFSI